MIASHIIQDISFEKDMMLLTIDGRSITVALDKVSSKLKNADEIQRQLFKISPSGYGIHWPLLDEDLAVDAIIKIAG
jgi:hypothetical protein